MTYIKSKKAGEICETGGRYCCLYHQKNKAKIKAGAVFSRCDFSGLNCEGVWHLIKEIKEKTPQEKFDAFNDKRRKSGTRNRDNDNPYKSKSTGYNKWDFEKW